MTKVSIILPSYNHSRFLKQRLDTIVNQTYTDWELIIIDDCSTDGSIDTLNEFVKEYSNKVKYFTVNELNSGGGYTSWEKGIELASTVYIWIAETDDYSDLNFLNESVAVLEQNKGCVLTFSTSVYVDEHKNILYDSTNRTEELQVKKGDSKILDGSILLNRMPFDTLITNGSSTVFRNPKKKLPNEIFQQRQSSDLFLWTYLVRGKEFAFLNKPLNYFRRHENSTTTRTSKFRQESVYYEKAHYLNFFEQPEKHLEFINHYIKYFINADKIRIFNIQPILKIENVKFIRLKYFKFMVIFYFNKLFKAL